MKKYLLFFGLFIFSAYSFAQGTDTTKKVSGVVKVSPFDLIANTLTFSVEKYLTNSMSLQLSGSFIHKDNQNRYQGGYDFKSVGGAAELQFREYVLTKSPLNGLYAGFFVKALHLGTTTSFNYSYQKTSAIYHQNNASGSYTYSPYYNSTPQSSYFLNQYSGGFMIGYQVIILKIITIDAYLGAGEKFSNDNYDGYIFDSILNTVYSAKSRVFPKIGLKIGVTF